MTNPIDILSSLINESQNILIFTGAGISTESGISDYRSKGGLWDKFQPVTIQEFLASEDKRKQYWCTKKELYASLEQARPNEGHAVIFEMEKNDKLKGIITQNIDGLHRMAGNSNEKILELHGNNRETICLSCSDITPWQEVYQRLGNGEEAPLCLKCKGFLKPNTISFGQNLNPEVLDRAVQWSKECDLLIAIGSTLIVEPAASLPVLAKQNGARLAIVTLSQTPLDRIADLKIEGRAGETLRAAMDLL